MTHTVVVFGDRAVEYVVEDAYARYAEMLGKDAGDLDECERATAIILAAMGEPGAETK